MVRGSVVRKNLAEESSQSGLQKSEYFLRGFTVLQNNNKGFHVKVNLFLGSYFTSIHQNLANRLRIH